MTMLARLLRWSGSVLGEVLEEAFRYFGFG